jgi:hypothetical protein
MRRAPRGQLGTSAKRILVLDPGRLIAARGGGDLGIAIRVAVPIPAVMQIQHNELLIAQQRRRRRS